MIAFCLWLIVVLVFGLVIWILVAGYRAWVASGVTERSKWDRIVQANRESINYPPPRGPKGFGGKNGRRAA